MRWLREAPYQQISSVSFSEEAFQILACIGVDLALLESHHWWSSADCGQMTGEAISFRKVTLPVTVPR